MTKRFTAPPSLDDIAALAEQAFAGLPALFRNAVEGVVFRVDEFPDDETAAELDLETPFDLLGLYHGLALDEKSLVDQPHGIDMIALYRRPILDYWCETGEDLEHVVRHVLIHEIGHHLGLDDDEMERIEEAP